MVINYPGKSVIYEYPVYINNGSWFLTTLKVYEGGGIEYWGPHTKQEFLYDVNSGWVGVDIPDGTEIRIGHTGLIVYQAKTILSDYQFDHKWITKESFTAAVLDAHYVGLGHKSASELCYDAFYLYKINPTAINEGILRKTYLDVPEHERDCILGDQDYKDFPIRCILGL